MTIVFSDLHLGKNPEEDASKLRELANCIAYFDGTGSDSSVEPIPVEQAPDLKQGIETKGPIKRVVFLGDTFDAFIEYPRFVPKPVLKWAEFAVRLQEKGFQVEYHAGNHDRWHLGFIEKKLKIPVHRDPQLQNWGTKRVWLEHGDCVIQHRGLVGFLKSISSKNWVYSLYRTVLPFGLGHDFAAWVSKTYSDFKVKPKTVHALREYAEQKIRQRETDVVLMGHCHQAGIETINQTSTAPSETEVLGVYVNTGNWHLERNFVLLSEKISIHCWAETGPTLIQEAIF